MKKKKKQRPIEYDDGRTIADMNVEGFRWYTPRKLQKTKEELGDLKLTARETFAMILGAYRALLPVLLLGFGGLILAMFFIQIWLT